MLHESGGVSLYLQVRPNSLGGAMGTTGDCVESKPFRKYYA